MDVSLGDIAGSVLSTLMLFAGAGMSGVFPSLGTGLIVGAAFTDDIKALTSPVLHKLQDSREKRIFLSTLQKRAQIPTLRREQHQMMKDETFENVEAISRTDSLIARIRENKETLGALASLVPLGIFYPAFLVVGGIITGLTLMAKKVVKKVSQVSIRINYDRSRDIATIYRRKRILNSYLRASKEKVEIFRDTKRVTVELKNKKFTYISPIPLKSQIFTDRDFNAIQPLIRRDTIFTYTWEELKQIYKHQNSIKTRREIFGIVYLIVDWETGLLKVGRTEIPLNNRRSAYLTKAKNFLKQNKKAEPIIKRIIDLYNQGGKRHVYSTLGWYPLEIVSRTGSSQEHIDFDKKYRESVEQWWQNKLGTKNPRYGYDYATGAQGPHSSKINSPSPWTIDVNIPKILINYLHLQKLLEKGCDYDQMVKVLSRHYPGALITKNVIIENIKYHWSSLAIRPDYLSPNVRSEALLKDARFYFIAPIIKNYVENGITNSKEISKKFISKENPQGLSIQTIIRAVKQEYQVSSWADFLKYCKAPLTTQSLVNLDINEFKKVGGDSLEEYTKFLIASYIIKGYTLEEIDNIIPGGYEGYSYRKIIKWWGGIQNARRILVAPILALCLKIGYNSVQIREKMPFFQKRMPNSKTWDAIRHYCLEWFKVNPSQIRQILTYKSLNQFLSEYLT